MQYLAIQSSEGYLIFSTLLTYWAYIILINWTSSSRISIRIETDLKNESNVELLT